MIIIKTGMKKIPDKCKNCKYSFLTDYESIRYCAITGKSIPYLFVPEKKNWKYIKPNWCPLEEVDE